MKKVLLLFAVLLMSANGFAQNKDNDGKYDYYCLLWISLSKVYIDCPWAKNSKGTMGMIDLGGKEVSVGNAITFMALHGWEVVSFRPIEESNFKAHCLMKKRVSNEEEAKEGIVLINNK